MTKTFSLHMYQKQKDLDAHFDFTSFQQGLFSPQPLLLYTWVFLFKFYFFFRKLY